MTDRHLRCREVVELLSDYLDGSVLGAEREEIERHLVTCDGCVAFLRQLRETVRVSRRLEVSEVPDAVMDHLLEAFRRR